MQKTFITSKSAVIIFGVLIFFLLQVGINSFAQKTEIDGLLKVLSPKQDTVRVWALLNIAHTYRRTDSVQVKKYANEALTLAKKLHYGRGEIRTYVLLGEMYYYQSNFGQADHWFDLVLDKSKAIQRVEDFKLAVLTSKATIAYHRGDYIKVAQYADIAIKEAKKAMQQKGNDGYHFERIIYVALNLKGAIHGTNAFNGDGVFVNKQEYNKAYEYFKQSLGVCQKYSSLRHNLTTVYHNMGCYHNDTKTNIDSALYYFDKEIHTAKALGQEVDLVGAYYVKAKILFDKNQLVAAEALLQQAQPLADKYQDPNHIVSIPHLLGKIYSKTGRHTQAIAILSKALTLVEEKKMTELKRAITEAIADSYHQHGDYKNALLYHKKASTLKDSLYNETTTKTINELSTKYETEKKTTTIKTLESQKMLRNYIILAMLFAFVGIIYAIYNRRKAYRIERKLLEQITTNKQQQIEKKQIEIDAKNRELSLHSLYLEQRKNILQEVKKQLINKQPEMLDKNALLREIDATMQLETEWQNFKIHFEEIHPRFFEKLLEHSPNLTELELRHCAYIKLGFSPKQVAQILSIETDSVSIARVRLKKKLKLQEDETLQAFLKNC